MDKDTFQTILSATVELIKEKGCRQTTLLDITSQTGLSKGAIYHYVKSKDELFGLILKSNMEEMNRRFLQSARQSKERNVQGPLESIVASLSSRDVSNEIFIYLLSQQHNESIKKILDELHDASLSLSVEWIGYGQQHGVIPAEADAESLASMFVTLFYGLRIQQMMDNRSDREASLLEALLRLMTTALTQEVK